MVDESQRTPGFQWPRSTDSHSQPQQSSNVPRLHPREHRGIREDIHHVIRGLGPLMEQSQNISLRSLFRHSQPTLFNPVQLQLPLQNSLNQNPHSAMEQEAGMVSPGNGRSSGGADFVVSVENESGSHPMMPSSPRVGGAREISGHGSNVTGNNNNEPTTPDGAAVNQQTDGFRQSPELMAAILGIEKFMPFFLILLAKLIFDHKIGILVIFGLIITFTHANSVIKREVGKQAKRNLSSLLAVIINLLTCIFFIYYLFEADKLHYSLVFIPTYPNHPFTLWDLLWIVSITDFVLKLITIVCKAFVVVLPGSFVAFQKKGKYYQFIEQTSQTYRALLPIQPWMFYLLEAYEGVGKLVGIILCGAYIIAKGNHLFHRFRDWKVALSKLIRSVTYGCTPTAEQVKLAGNMCPICQDSFRLPTILQCKHIFCEECVSVWFDRERTCPMCRAQIADDPTWRDGATTFFLQLF